MTQPAPQLPGLSFERLLGSGGYSDVYLYRQRLPSRQVAVKVLKANGLGEAQRRQFTAEANTMAGLSDHPHIVPVFSADVSADGRPYLVMMFYARPNLAVRAASERLGVAEVLRIGIQIASAVETAHRAGILHRDIKPANLLTSQYGTPGLADFGIAGQAAILDDEDTGVSVPWAAPEVLYAVGSTSVRSDVYSLAATLWHLLVGRSPFEVRGGDNSQFALMGRVRDAPPPPTGRADVPDALDRLLRQAMAKDPLTRTQSAIELARGLQAAEQELRLPRTDIIVTTDRGDGGGAGYHAADPTTPPTVARPAAFSPQVELPPAGRRDPSGAPPTTVRPTTYSAQGVSEPQRYHRESPAAARDHAPPPARRRRVPFVVGGLLLAGLAVVGAVVLGSGGDAPSQPRSTVPNSAGTPDAGNLGDNITPGTPKIVGRRDGTALVFRWTYSAARPGDTYLWRLVGASRSSAVSQPRLVLSLADTGGSRCLQVKVVRADGSNASARWSPSGCAP